MNNVINFYKDREKVYSVYANTVEEVKENPTSYYKDYSKNMIITDINYQYPVIEAGSIREMTKEEKIKAGIEVTLEEGEVIKNKKLLKIEKPSKYHKWQNNEWVVNLEEVKNIKREELKVIRTNKLYENITVNGDTFQVREHDLENFWEADYMLSNSEVQETDTRNWILADNSIKVFTYLQILNVLTEFIKRKAKIFDKFGELSIKLSAAKSAEEIEKIEWK
ncbi:hypothetical protein YWH7199_03125 [Fusobacterium nucleatum YWH7199]|uniref:DUF4376 domain-containing protein n=1 Tax=Fusobacterium nucleatum TaxID=851 RepID=UPI00201A9718|nr:DUF4376 domain-containing protein [Fusobacterium nucleatum]MCL4580507.1 hypothetical protein [Fusobacterium nucleatum YWH7199]